MLKYGLWSHGDKLIKLSVEQATDIQDGRMDLSQSTQILQKLGEEKLVFFNEINVLTNKFEPFENFATE